ncbi:efflux RND transporter periplasmic adaptor subunit [Ensifer soli]|uniref:efflux RND transporter periplasmic adaptor subunit n=1 Tax=Ciceribacter sp. sgz301302 TaxID=3342379 RepID=UPI0035B6D53A
MTGHRIVTLGIVTLGFCAMIGAFSPAIAAEEAAPPQQAEPALPAIVVTTVETRALTDRVRASGTIRPVEEIYVAPLVEGLSIRSLGADIGDRVAEGATLATLNDDALILQKSQAQATLAKAEAAIAQFEAQLAEAKANAEEAERVAGRAERLSATGTVATATADQARAAATAARARVNSAEQAITVARADTKVADAQIDDIDLRLSRTAVKAPAAGIVAERTAKVGAVASGAGTPLFTLIRDGAIELVADLSETDIQKVDAGQTAIVTIAGGTRTIEGKVRLVSPTIDAATRLGSVHIVLDARTGARAGMFANAEIVVAEANGLALPLSAVTTDRNGSVARKVEDDVVRQVKIVTGIQDGGVVQVVEGLSAGDRVVAKAGAFVRDGDRIRPVAEDETASVAK